MEDNRIPEVWLWELGLILLTIHFLYPSLTCGEGNMSPGRRSQEESSEVGLHVPVG